MIASVAPSLACSYSRAGRPTLMEAVIDAPSSLYLSRTPPMRPDGAERIPSLSAAAGVRLRLTQAPYRGTVATTLSGRSAPANELVRVACAAPGADQTTEVVGEAR
jgi:hypothetical protein